MNMTNKGVFTALMHMISHIFRFVNPVFANFDAYFSLFSSAPSNSPPLRTPHDAT